MYTKPLLEKQSIPNIIDIGAKIYGKRGMRGQLKLFVIMGPYGVGKSTIISQSCQKKMDLVPIIPMTTRAKRPGEIDGIDYHFVEQRVFKDHLAAGKEFLQHIEFHGNHYGSLMESLEQIFDTGKHAVIALSDSALAQARRRCECIVTIFIQPPNKAALEKRLFARGDAGQELEKRYNSGVAILDAMREDLHEHIITNDLLDVAVEDFCAIIDHYNSVSEAAVASAQKSSFTQDIVDLMRLSDSDISSIESSILGGWSNKNFRIVITLATGKETLLFAKKMMLYSDTYQDREQERKNLEALRSHTFCPQLLAIDLHIGLQVFNYLEGYRSLTPADFSDPLIHKKVIGALSSLHTIKPFDNCLDVFNRSTQVFKHLEKKDFQLEPNSKAILKLVSWIGDSLKKSGTTLIPCHNDTTPSNFLISSENVMLVDFENAGNNDPAWDLAYLSIETQMQPEQETAMATGYIGEDGDIESLRLRMTLLKMVVMHWISLWTALQVCESNPSQAKVTFMSKSSDSLRRASMFAKQHKFTIACAAVCEPDEDSQSVMKSLISDILLP